MQRNEPMNSMEKGTNNKKDMKEYLRDTPLRESLLNWYEWKRDSIVLELNAEYGALTGLLSRSCKEVISLVNSEEERDYIQNRYAERDNVRVFLAEEWKQSNSPNAEFDYIIACNQLEKEQDLQGAVTEWMSWLTDEGTLLLCVQNRYGLKYFCGAKDPYTKIPYDGINGYFQNEDFCGRCIGKREITDAIQEIAGCNYQLYYPVPDSRMPQFIFSDSYREGINVSERLIDYNYEGSGMYGIEHRIFGEMIQEGALPFLSNSFLFEITKRGKLSDVIYAVITTDRGEEAGMATTIMRDGTVKKRPLWKAGEENLKKLNSYTEDLKNHGIPIVSTKLEESQGRLYLTMPFVKMEGLTSVLKRFSKSDKAKVIHIFDEIYQYILQASEVEASGDLGPILKKAYIDLAPCNCFYNKETGGLLFYDQEFVMEHCPAQFAMYRTLKYCYASAKEMDERVSLRDMLQRYDISDEKILIFEEQEKEFIGGLRKKDQYQVIYEWGTPGYQSMYRELQHLSEREKERKRKPYKVGYVPGVFDLFHTGHLRLLERCKERCEYLIVGVLTDELVEYYKGHGTVISYEDRARVIEALKVVDEVIPVDFTNTDKLDAWEQLHYDCHFSGDDHINHWNDIREELRKRGAEMEFFSYTQGISSTQIREKMKE